MGRVRSEAAAEEEAVVGGTAVGAEVEAAGAAAEVEGADAVAPGEEDPDYCCRVNLKGRLNDGLRKFSVCATFMAKLECISFLAISIQ